MHELSIATAVLKAVRGETGRYPEARVSRIGLKVGEFSGVNTDALRFCLEALMGDSELAGAALEIIPSPRRHVCRRCGETFTIVDYQTTCPACAAADTTCVAGEELELTYLEMEEA